MCSGGICLRAFKYNFNIVVHKFYATLLHFREKHFAFYSSLFISLVVTSLYILQTPLYYSISVLSSTFYTHFQFVYKIFTGITKKNRLKCCQKDFYTWLR